jgi:hypothetical protein
MAATIRPAALRTGAEAELTWSGAGPRCSSAPQCCACRIAVCQSPLRVWGAASVKSWSQTSGWLSSNSVLPRPVSGSNRRAPGCVVTAIPRTLRIAADVPNNWRRAAEECRSARSGRRAPRDVRSRWRRYQSTRWLPGPVATTCCRLGDARRWCWRESLCR